MSVNTVDHQNTTNIYQGASQKAIQYHYDVSNEFYKLWLDNTMSYSSALWEEDENLEQLELAQIRKLDYHIKQAYGHNNVNRVLDIGCGWGAILKRLVENYDAEEAIGLTLSEAQANFISSFDHPQIKVKLENWLDHNPEKNYDAIISIGAFEHFASLDISKEEKLSNYTKFFQKCHDWLNSEGYLSLQTITYETSDKETLSTFITDSIFPESDLPHLSEIIQASNNIFEIVNIRNDRKHYQKTLKVWLSKLKNNRSEAIKLVGEEIVTKYEKYFNISMIGFHLAKTNLSRITLKRLN